MDFLKKVLAWAKTSVLVKNAVNAAVLSLVQMYHDPTDNNFHNWHGVKGIMWQVGAAVLAREGMIVIPKILKWSTTNGGDTMKGFIVVLFLLCASTLSAQTAPKPQEHAIVKVASVIVSPVTHPKRALKDILGSVMFATENVVDVVHGGLAVADKVLDVVSIQGKVPALDAVYAVVSIGDKDTGKLDVWLERQEDFLFGTHN